MERPEGHITHGSLFSGIGGFDLAAEWAGWQNIFHCEWEEFPRRLLNYYWPKAISYEDITQTDFTIHRGNITVLSGGFPCQPYSHAGARRGTDDERNLWPSMLRAIQEIQPRFIVAENVLGFANWNDGLVFEEVCSNMESEGYEVQPFILPAAGQGAPHSRQRVFIVAHAISERGFQGISHQHSGLDNPKISPRNPADTHSDLRPEGRVYQERREEADGHLGPFNPRHAWGRWENFPTQSPIHRGSNGLSGRLDGITVPRHRRESIKALGNAVVPQVAYQIFNAINTWISEQ